MDSRTLPVDITQIRFGCWHLDLARQTLFDGDEIRELEPLLFKILYYFICNREKMITRQDLIENVWQQTYVDDNAINRAIFELRKVLKSNREQSQLIKTHYKKGYTFQADIALLNTPPADLEDESETELLSAAGGSSIGLSGVNIAVAGESLPEPQMSYRYLLIAIAVILLAWAGYYIFADSKTVLRPEMEVLSWKKGVSVEPRFMAERNLLAFSFRDTGSKVFSLYVKNLQTAEEVELVQGQSDILPVGWATKQAILYYQYIELGEGGLCELWQADLSDGLNRAQHKKVMDCNTGYLLSADSTDPNSQLTYTKYHYRDRANLSAMVNRDLVTGKEYQVTSPNISSQGDYFIKFSESGKQVVFLRENSGGTQLFIANVDGSEQRRLYNFSYFIKSVAWVDDDKKLSWFDRDKQTVVRFDIASRTYSEQMIAADERLKDTIVLSGENIIGVTGFQDSDILTLTYPNGQAEVSTYSGSDMHERLVASFHASQDSVYISGGRKDSLWIKENGIRRKLLDFPYGGITEVLISPDDSRFLIARNSELLVYSFETLGLVQQIRMDGKIKHISWSDNSNILFSSVEDNVDSAWLYNLTGSALAQFGESNIDSIKKIDEEKYLLLTSDHQLKLWNKSNDTFEFVADLSDSPFIRWVLIKDVVYYTNGREIFRLPLSGEKGEKIYKLENGFITHLKTGRQNGDPFVYFTLVRWKNNQLFSLKF